MRTPVSTIRMLRAFVMSTGLAALPLGVAAAAGAAPAQEPQAAEEATQAGQPAEQDDTAQDDSAQEMPDGEPLDLSTPEPDATKPKSLQPFAAAPLASDWKGKAGIDYRKPAIPAATFQPESLLAGAVPDQSTGVAWANLNAPGLDEPLGWDKTVIESRVDPAQDQGKLGTTLSRSLLVNDNFSVTLQNGVSVTRTLAGPLQPPAQFWASSQAVQFNVLPTDTSVSLGTSFSTLDDRWQRTLIAEQKLFGGPFNVTGSVSESGAGEISRSLKAGFKRTW
jgi:hypothetical protein